jgi:hypothetical protein
VLLAVASVLAGGYSAKGAAVPEPVAGDLFVGFRVSGGIGGSTSYLVKLGLDTAFTGSLGTSFSLSLGDLAADLQATYGTPEVPWYERTDLYWGIFGTRGGASPTVYGSKERTGESLTLSPWPALGQTARSSVDTQIGSVLNNIGGYRSLQATGNSPVAAFQPNSSQGSSYAFQVGTPGTNDFGSLSQWGSIEGSFANGTDGTSLDLFRISSSGVTYRGSFSIDDEGVISYSVVPEPSTAVLLLIGGAAIGGFRRRRLAHA